MSTPLTQASTLKHSATAPAAQEPILPTDRQTDGQTDGEQMLLTCTTESLDDADARVADVAYAVGPGDGLLYTHIKALYHFTFAVTVQLLTIVVQI